MEYAILGFGIPCIKRQYQDSPIRVPNASHEKTLANCTLASTRGKSRLASYPEPIQQILYNRGHSTSLSAEQFLNAELPPGTDPF